MKNGISPHKHPGHGAVLEGRSTGAGLKADAVVPNVNRAVGHEHVAALHKVYAVAVLGVPRAAHRHSHDGHLAAALRHQMEARGVLDGNAANPHPLAVGKADKMVAQLFLLLVPFYQVGEAGQVVRIPKGPAVGIGPTHTVIIFPLHVADLAALDGAPPFTVSVDNAFSADTHVFTLACTDARHSLFTVLGKERPVGRHQNHGILLKVQVDTALEHYGPSEPDTGRHHEMPSALLDQGLHSLGKSVGIKGYAITHAAKIGERN